jgi:ABC-type multidrug transport system fused ATPase/permease subunit
MADHADDADVIMGAVESALKPHVDDDTCEYISSLLEEDPADTDAREAVQALIEGAVDGMTADQVDGVQLCRVFFELLDLSCSSSDNDNPNQKDEKDEPAPAAASAPLRKLEQAVTIGDKDVQSFASGLQADADPTAAAGNDEKESKIAAFYANMIDVKSNYLATSERVRRKARQKEIRERMEEEERQRAIEEAMAMFTVTPGAGAGDGDSDDPSGAGAATVDTMMENSSDNAQDVHFRNLDLPNLRGGGENLLQNANIMLARGKRYGLMGRNGCGTLVIRLCTYMSRV